MATMEEIFCEATPSVVRESKNVQLFTEATLNGKKVHILLEELHRVYKQSWDTHLIDLEIMEHKQPWFLRLNPNGLLPVLLDSSRSPPVPIMESSAILVYLQEYYDPDNVFGFTTPAEKSQVLQWLFFWHTSSPIQTFTRYFSVRKPLPVAAEYFRPIMLRVYSTLEDHLSGKHRGVVREYLAGSGSGKFSIADMGIFPHVEGYLRVGFSEDDMAAFPNLLKWIDRIAQKETVKTAMSDKYYSQEHPDLVLRTT